ncbi:polyribonucleotide 5'-hydroxyl-kinase [Angomonas deanei]|uniref:N-terminal beta-sandwich domain of polyadenylation factor/mRNA cleavage and polyadenylation factor CLP1 P-loop, putative n=1 Tax=Angomonas deanei TaxID=59799 RepID=A0A7G2CC75_9TRYP|nr:polyribonucleotide 5'-hydroxyl-kinase [Angomonas deanei]CAD2217416.1 N-terminal beta-sandwich domain of polyadenylation factor/mRNA cleavage and polyadenylation factor CLP1 P-loop, putative [Angomonas deanei]|eukprot:EPY39228.1 polyribonucleotide 5'-hydroxyl-kinase [Angomonas deanei]
MEQETMLVSLSPGGELFFRVPTSSGREGASVRVVPTGGGGDARVEAKGCPLIIDVSYILVPGTTYSVYSWTNAKLEITGSAELLGSVFRAPSHSIFRPIAEFHCYLHTKRDGALKSGARGPIALICGKNSETKCTIAQTLCNYASRSNWKPLLVDMNCGCEQLLSIPGCISAGIIEQPMTPDSVPSESILSLSYFTGSLYCSRTDPDGSLKIPGAYVHYCKVLCDTVNKRLMEQSSNVYGASGAVVVVPDLPGSAGINCISDIIYQLGVDHVLCADDDDTFNRLYLRHEMMDKSGVVVDKISCNFCSTPNLPPEKTLAQQFEDYFNGKGQTILSPSRWAKPFTALEILSVKEQEDQIRLVQLEHEELEKIIGCIGALYHKDEIVSLLQATPLCFVRVQSVDTTGITFLTTTHYTFPSEKLALVVGSLRWVTS